MRLAVTVSLLSLLAAAPAVAQQGPIELQASIPAGIHRLKEGGIALGPYFLTTGELSDPVRLLATLSAVDGEVGAPYRANWHMTLGDWCPAADATVSAVLIDPSGRKWPGGARSVPAGGLYPQEPHRFFGSGDTPELLTALDQGGRFTLALEDDQGRRLEEVIVQVPDAAARRRMNTANRALLRRTDPASVPPVREDRIEAFVPSRSAPRSAPPPRPQRTCTPN